MTLRSEKILSQILVSAGILLGLEALVYVLNLNQNQIYIRLAIIISIYIMLKYTFYFDLHFKSFGVLACEVKEHKTRWDWLLCRWGMLKDYSRNRFVHFGHWKTLRHWINCLGLPFLLYWATVALIFLNFNKQLVQQIIVLLSGTALSLIFWHIKEIYINKLGELTEATYVSLQSIKLYTAFIIFFSGLGLVNYYCLPWWLLPLAVFCGIFTLMYQSLFHLQQIRLKTIFIIFLIAVILGSASALVFMFWGLNYSTGSLFLLGLYNFFWGIYSYHLRGRLTREVFIEHVLITLLVSTLSIGTTNFRARILPYC